tara:strand:+ start:1040 stop:2704 length:1665 start_codon:yes stop_codon:yes gene_type:complete
MSEFTDSNSVKKYGDGTKSSAGALKDSILANELKLYKKRVASQYQLLKPSRIKDINGKVWISVKVDGECWFLLKKGNNFAFSSYNGRVIENVPALEEAKKLLSNIKGDLIVAGELFSSGENKFDEMKSLASETGIGVFVNADESDLNTKIQKASTNAGGMADGFIGSEIGALIDTAILPGVESVLGAIIGDELGGKAGRVRVHSVAKTIANDKSSNQLGFKAFDLVQEGDRKYHGEPYEEKLRRMAEIFKGGKRVNVAPTFVGKDASDVVTCYREWVDSRLAEGLVVRNEHGIVYKIKPRIEVDAVVVGFGERRNAYPDLGELVVGLKREDGSYHILGSVGVGFSDDERMEWHKRLSSMVVDSYYRYRSTEGMLVRFVKPEIVVQVRCSDLQPLNSRDHSIMKMVLDYSGDGYDAKGQMPLVSLIHPVFQKEREDKKVNTADVGLEQVYSIVPFESRNDEAKEIKLNSSKTIQREVYVKVTKELRSVRKFVAIETNKNKQDSRYPPFVLYTTDFSPTRASPLNTNILVAPNKKTLDGLITAWKEKNVKGGWNLA